MTDGTRTSSKGLAAARERALEQRARLPLEHRRLEARRYEVRRTPALVELQRTVATGIRRRHSL